MDMMPIVLINIVASGSLVMFLYYVLTLRFEKLERDQEMLRQYLKNNLIKLDELDKITQRKKNNVIQIKRVR